MKGIVFDIKRYSVHDGPGLRTTVFFKGCPLRCLWCHNPESQRLKPQIIWYGNKCMSCFDCFNACKFNAINTKNGINIIEDRCTLCGDCVGVCSTGALETVGKEYATNELIDEILKDEPFFENGGGVTISGGEPFVQYEFLMEILEILHREKLHIALDTTGYTDKSKLLESAKYVSLFLYDLKLMDSSKHRRYTGVGNKKILDNLVELDRAGAKIAIRIPIIPTINDDDKNIKDTAEFLSNLNNVESVDLLPYHSIMVDKYRRLKIPFLLGDIDKPKDEKMESLRKVFETYEFKVNLGG